MEIEKAIRQVACSTVICQKPTKEPNLLDTVQAVGRLYF